VSCGDDEAGLKHYPESIQATNDEAQHSHQHQHQSISKESIDLPMRISLSM
jgi:hypothetical protein